MSSTWAVPGLFMLSHSFFSKRTLHTNITPPELFKSAKLYVPQGSTRSGVKMREAVTFNTATFCVIFCLQVYSFCSFCNSSTHCNRPESVTHSTGHKNSEFPHKVTHLFVCLFFHLRFLEDDFFSY